MGKGRLAPLLFCSVVLGWFCSANAQQGNVTYTYDALGRVTKATYGDGSAANYGYDLAGNRLTSSSAPPPDAVNDAITTNEDTAKTFDPRVNDTDPGGLALTITAKTNGTKGAVTIVGGTQLTYTPTANLNGADTFTYTISNGSATDTATVNVTLTPVNDAPNAVNDTLVAAAGTPKTFDPRTNDTDVEGSALTITAATNGTKGTVTRTTTQVTYTATAGATGADSFTYTISDGALTDTATVSVTLAAAPNAVNDATTTNEDTAKTFDPRTNDTDPNGLALTITAKTNGTKGTVTIVGGTQLTYAPNANANGADSFTYTISNGALTDTATVNVTITPVNDAPNAVNDSISVTYQTAKTFDPRTNDTDPENTALTITAKTNGTKGTVTIVSGTQLTYTPATGKYGADSFTYTISDGSLTDSATVTVNIPVEVVRQASGTVNSPWQDNTIFTPPTVPTLVTRSITRTNPTATACLQVFIYPSGAPCTQVQTGYFNTGNGLEIVAPQ